MGQFCSNTFTTLLLVIIICASSLIQGSEGKKSPGQKKSCTKPNTLDNAEIHTKYQNKEMFKHRDKIGYKCLPGFVKEGKLFQKCHDGQWTSVQGDCKLNTKRFGNKRPTQKNPCTKPIGVVNHAAIHPDYQNEETFKHRDRIRYECLPGFLKEGDLSQECQDGKWTSVQGKCKPGRTCSKPADVANANLRSKYRDIETFTESSEVEYDCNIGYSITGRSRNRKCLKSGNWSPVEFDCELIRCTYLPHPENGRRTDANNGAGETTRFSCNPGYTLKGPSQLVCRTDGEWSPRYTPKCEPILCPELSSLRNGDIFQDTSDGVRNNYGSIAQYTCNYGFTINGTRSRQINRRCEADGTWDGHNYFCDTEKCEPIEFYGGNLQYFGSIHRSEGTYAYYSCHDGYTMSPPGIDYSECKRTSLRWEPEPPKCYGNCRFEEYQPIDSSVVWRQRARTDRDAIIHGEKIIYSCTNQRWNELCVRPNDHDLCTYYLENFETTCINGTFDKINRDTLITCPEKRCSITYQTNTCVWSNGENCIKENYKIQSQSSVNVKCNDGNRYELFENIHKRYHNVDSSTMKCDRGNLLTDLSCLPKRCDMSDIPTNMFTSRTPDKRHIMHNEQIVYRCINDQYELYVNSTNSFPRAFTSTCRFGDFDVPKQNFPMCIDRRCNITYQTSVFAHACFWTDDDHGGQCKPENFKIASGSSVNIGCKDGYELYDPIQAKYIDLERSEMTCIKGQYSKNLSCKRKRCVLSHLPMNNFTIRTPVGTHIEHGQSISYKCENPDDYELYVDNSDTYTTSFSARCNLGHIATSLQEFPLCLEKPCEFQPWDGVCYRKGTQCHSKTVKLKSQESIAIKCNKGYKLVMESGFENGESPILKCVKGKPDKDIKCVSESIWTSISDYFQEKVDKATTNFYALASRFICRFSIDLKNNCKDSCLADRIENGVVASTVDSVNVLQEVEHGLQVYTHCIKGYDREGPLNNTCENGKWKYSFPKCIPKPCNLALNGNEILLYNGRLMRTEEIFQNGDRLQISCAEGYTLRPNTSVYDEVDNEWMTCVLGSWKNHHTCTPKQCRVPEVDHASIKAPTRQFVHDLDKVEFKCEKGYHFNQTFSKKAGRTTVGEFVATCSLGKWSPTIPPQCNPDGCHFSVHEGSHYFISNEKLSEASLIEHNTDVTTNCSDGYDLIKNGSLVNYTHSTVTCHLGSWQNIHLCRKRIAGQDHSIETATDVTLQTSPTSTEQLPDENNETTSTESDANTIADVTMPSTLQPIEQPLECEIPVYSIYEFSFNGERKEGSMVPHKTVLNVKCRILNYDYNSDDDQQTVQCINGILGTANISCQTEPPVEEKTFSCKLENGKVRRRSNWNFEEYYLNVSCNEGYKLNLILPDKPYCKCSKTGDLMCDYGGQTPKCLPEDCKIPKEFDQRLTLYERSEGQIVGLSKGQTVEHGKTVYFKCTHSITERFEPYNTPFTCMNGKWLEDATHEEWTKTNSSYFPQCIKVNCDIPGTYSSLLNIYVKRKGSTTSLSGGMSVDHGESVYFNCSNTATDYFEIDDTRLECMKGKWLKVSTQEWLNSNSSKFPECRTANCVPMCQNGGKCVGNNKCMCQPKSTGSICETVECDPECLENGGKCTGPGICGLCPAGKNGHNCQLSEHSIKYVIQIKTGTDFWAGTGASVYVYLHGPKSATQKLYINGSYVGGGLVKRIIWAEDVTPIQYIYVGRESVNIRDDWQVDFVSIIVDFDNDRTTTDDQFYLFDAEPDLWIHDSVDQIIRLSEIKYLIQVKTGSNTYAGPDAKLYVILHGDKYSSQKFYVGKTYYEKGKLYEDSLTAVDITPIRSITIGRDSVRHPNPLQVDFVSIFVDFDNGRTTIDDQFYNFDADLWIDDNAVRTITLSGHPDRCVHKFKHRPDIYPFNSYVHQGFHIGGGPRMSERACKQQCILNNIKTCIGVYYEKANRQCTGFEISHKPYFSQSHRQNYYERYCL